MAISCSNICSIQTYIWYFAIHSRKMQSLCRWSTHLKGIWTHIECVKWERIATKPPAMSVLISNLTHACIDASVGDVSRALDFGIGNATMLNTAQLRPQTIQFPISIESLESITSSFLRHRFQSSMRCRIRKLNWVPLALQFSQKKKKKCAKVFQSPVFWICAERKSSRFRFLIALLLPI